MAFKSTYSPVHHSAVLNSISATVDCEAEDLEDDTTAAALTDVPDQRGDHHVGFTRKILINIFRLRPL